MQFKNNTASESPAPGGGSISAYTGSLGAALGTMVANLSAHKRGWDERWEEFSDWAEKGKYFHTELLKCVDEDTDAFNNIMRAFALPKNSDDEKTMRNAAIQEATENAIRVPLKVMKLSCESLDVLKAMAEIGNPNSVSDAGVGALCARTAVEGAYLNVKINASGCNNKTFLNEALNEAENILNAAREKEKEIILIVNKKIDTQS